MNRQHILFSILCCLDFTCSPTNRLWDTDHRDQDPGGCGDQMCDILWQSQDNNEILEPERARNCCCDAVWRNWPSLIHHILCEKRMWWDSQRFVKKCDIDVTAAWQQVPTASEHYWSIVSFSWRGSFCRQPSIIVTRGWGILTLTSARARKGLLSSFWEPWSRNCGRWQGFLLLRSDSKYERWRRWSINNGLTATDIFKVF